jgi:hypothetical protein
MSVLQPAEQRLRQPSLNGETDPLLFAAEVGIAVIKAQSVSSFDMQPSE